MTWRTVQHIDAQEMRRAERDDLNVPITVKRRTPPITGPEPALLVNLSPYGFLIRTALTVIDGCQISIELPIVGDIRARSVWSMEDQIGGEFLSPIDPRFYGRVLATLLSARAK